MIKDQIIEAIEKASGAKKVGLEFPENDGFGDYSTNIAMVLAKEEDKNPRKLAEEIKAKFESLPELMEIISRIEIAGPGFINFWLKKEVLVENLTDIEEKGESYGKSDVQKGKKLMFEFAHPNTHKAFHIGHLRNITTGEGRLGY